MLSHKVDKNTPLKGFIIEAPYDKEVGVIVIFSVIPMDKLDWDTVNKAKAEYRVLAEKDRLKNEDELDFKRRLEKIVDKIRKQKQASLNT